MNEVEFTAVCKLNAYASAAIVNHYTHEKPKGYIYTTDDVIAVYGLGAGHETIHLHGHRIGNGFYSDGGFSQGATTKKYEV